MAVAVRSRVAASRRWNRIVMAFIRVCSQQLSTWPASPPAAASPLGDTPSRPAGPSQTARRRRLRHDNRCEIRRTGSTAATDPAIAPRPSAWPSLDRRGTRTRRSVRGREAIAEITRSPRCPKYFRCSQVSAFMLQAMGGSVAAGKVHVDAARIAARKNSLVLMEDHATKVHLKSSKLIAMTIGQVAKIGSGCFSDPLLRAGGPAAETPANRRTKAV